jgi:hypothetical protein
MRILLRQAPANDLFPGRLHLGRWAATPASILIRINWAPVAVLAVAGLPLAGFTSLVLHHFYITGGFFWDSGLLAFLLSEQNPRLPTPQIFGGESFFSTHVTPIFVVAALLRRLLPVTNPQFFAGFIGLCHALPGIGVFWMLHWHLDMRRPLMVAVGATVAIVFSFNGLALAIARYPHFEMLIVGSFILFAVALIGRRLIVAGICFVICLGTREDAGFQLFAVLFLLILLNRYRGAAWDAQLPEVAFAAIALTYSLIVLGLQLSFITGQSSFARIYLGDPPFNRLTFAIVSERLLGWVLYRTYIVLPGLIALLWAVHARNPYVVLGYVAFLPWAIVHLAAQSDIAGTLSGYYAYPFMIASFWPLAGVAVEQRTHERQGLTVVSVLAFATMVAGSFTAVTSQYDPGHLDLPESFVAPPSLVRQATSDRVIALLSQSTAELGAVLVDGSVLALAPDGFTDSETVSGARTRHPDTVIYFASGYEAEVARMIASDAGLGHYYLVPGTSIRLATDRSLEPASPLVALLTSTPSLQ